MRLRWRLIIIIGIVWALFMVLIFMGTKFYLLKNIKMYEQSEFDKDIERVQKSINQTLQTLGIFTLDWSYWNDAYKYLEGKNPRFIVDNIDLLTFASIHVNILIYVDKKGSIVMGISMDKDNTKFIPYPKGLEKYIYPGSMLEQHKEAIKSKKGLAYVDDCILLIASSAVSNTDLKKPIMGTLITARYFTQDLLQEISNDANLSLYLYLPDNIKKDIFLTQLITRADKDNNLRKIILLTNAKTAHGYLILRDIKQKPIGIIKIDLPRTIFLTGLKTIRYYLVALVLTAFLLVLMIWFLLRIFIINRLENLTRKIHDINVEKDYSSRLQIKEKDEISELSSEFNNMMKIIDSSNKKTLKQIDQLELSHNRLEFMNKKLVNEVNERKQAEVKAKTLTDDLVLASRKAGMADIANSVLHSLKNVLNNIVTGVAIIKQHLQQFPSTQVEDIAKNTKVDKQVLNTEIVNLENNISRMKNIILMQEALSSVADVPEEIQLSEIINDSLILNKIIYRKSKIQIEKIFKFDEKIIIDRVKLLHILVSVCKCAIESLLMSKVELRKLIIATEKIDEENFTIIICENGMGIAIEEINKLLMLGEVDNESKYLIGIQASMIFCKDMRGSLTVERSHFGTMFIITLPIFPPKK